VKRLYGLVLQIDAKDPVADVVDLDELVGNVIEWSTAREAIVTGLDAAGEGRITLDSFRLDKPLSLNDPRFLPDQR
jgi:hypothetical protein